MLFNFTEEDLARGTIVDAGEWYAIEIIAYKDATAKTDSSALAKFTGIILGGKFKGTKLYWQFSEKAKGFAKPFVEALTGAKATTETNVELGENLKGRKLEVYVTRGEYKGKPQNEISDFRPLSE